jgi:tetratricopeptide (TPR) repeat protein
VVASNERLAKLMREAAFLAPDGSIGRNVFARAVTAEARRQGSDRSYNHTYVKRWLDGMIPRDQHTRECIVNALARKLGRRVGLDEAGFGGADPFPSELGLEYPKAAQESIEVVARLWRADLEDAQTLLLTGTNVAAWNEASLNWLVSPPTDWSDPPVAGRKIGFADIERIRTTTELFGRLDNQYGGGHARRSLIEFLHSDLSAALRGTYTGETAKALFSAAAEASLLAAWMSYDAGVHGIAQRYFIQALRLAQEGNDRLLAGSILDAMSHQATFLGRFREAANLARAAHMGTVGVATPTLTAHFHVMEARAHARLGAASDCDAALSAAVREFERRKPSEGPDFLDYFDDAELAAEFGHCNRDLGRAGHATTYATQSLGEANGEYLRSDFFATMVLADAYLDQGEDEQACQVALKALEIGEQLKSARCVAYVDEFRERLAKLGNSTIARNFKEHAETVPLWRPAI